MDLENDEGKISQENIDQIFWIYKPILFKTTSLDRFID